MSNPTNIFILTNNAIQHLIINRLYIDFDLEDERNILLYRKSTTDKTKTKCYISEKKWSKIYTIPFFTTKNRIVKWLNFFIYIAYILKIYFTESDVKKIVVGNYLYNGNRAILNILKNRIQEAIVIDEGLSTINIWSDRNKLIKSQKKFNFETISKTYHPEYSLLFYSNFNLGTNNADRHYHAKGVFDNNLKDLKIIENSVLFIGSPLVEAKIINETSFQIFLDELVRQNKGAKVTYIVHPKEKYIYESGLAQSLDLEIITLNKRLEEYLLEVGEISKVIASCFSTALIYSSLILEDRVKYQTYILDEKHFFSKEKYTQVNKVYSTIEKQLEKLENRLIKI